MSSKVKVIRLKTTGRGKKLGPDYVEGTVPYNVLRLGPLLQLLRDDASQARQTIIRAANRNQLGLTPTEYFEQACMMLGIEPEEDW